MTQITLTFEMNKGLVGMVLETHSRNPTKEEKTVASQMINHITEGKLQSPTVAMIDIEKSSIEEAKKKASIIADIYLAGR